MQTTQEERKLCSTKLGIPLHEVQDATNLVGTATTIEAVATYFQVPKRTLQQLIAQKKKRDNYHKAREQKLKARKAPSVLAPRPASASASASASCGTVSRKAFCLECAMAAL